jgi:hypothetical protein
MKEQRIDGEGRREIEVPYDFGILRGRVAYVVWIGYGWDVWATACYDLGGIVVFTDDNQLALQAFSKRRGTPVAQTERTP